MIGLVRFDFDKEMWVGLGVPINELVRVVSELVQFG